MALARSRGEVADWLLHAPEHGWQMTVGACTREHVTSVIDGLTSDDRTPHPDAIQVTKLTTRRSRSLWPWRR